MQIVRFLAVGVLNSGLGLVVIFAAMAAGMEYRAANAIGYATGIAFSFVANRRWTFADDGDWLPSFLKWLAVVSVAYVTQLGAVVGLHQGLGVQPYVSQLLGLPIYTLISFLGARGFVFAGKPAA